MRGVFWVYIFLLPAPFILIRARRAFLRLPLEQQRRIALMAAALSIVLFTWLIVTVR
jgi:hypothetical protein